MPASEPAKTVAWPARSGLHEVAERTTPMFLDGLKRADAALIDVAGGTFIHMRKSGRLTTPRKTRPVPLHAKTIHRHILG